MVFYIYKFTDCNYIGSTKDIKKRLLMHKLASNNKLKSDLKIYKFIKKNNIEFKLKILYHYPYECSDKIQRLVEQFYINKYNSINNGLNSFNAFTSKKQRLEQKREKANEYYETNKKKKKFREQRKQYCKQYYQINKQRWTISYQNNIQKNKQKSKIKINCHICGSLVCKKQIKRHQRSKKCQNFVKLK